MAIFNDLISIAGLKALFDELKGKVSLKGHDHADLTIKDALGGDKTYNGTEPITVEALRGEDGYSPTIEVSDSDTGHQLTIKDKNGTQTVDIKDGKDGAGGAKMIQNVTGIPAVCKLDHNNSGYPMLTKLTFNFTDSPDTYREINLMSVEEIADDMITLSFVIASGSGSGWDSTIGNFGSIANRKRFTIYKPTFEITDTDSGGKKLTINYEQKKYELEVPGSSGGSSEALVALDTPTSIDDTPEGFVHADNLRFAGDDDQEACTVTIDWHAEQRSGPTTEIVPMHSEIQIPAYENFPEYVTNLKSLTFTLYGPDGSKLEAFIEGSRDYSGGSSLHISIPSISDKKTGFNYFVDSIKVS